MRRQEFIVTALLSLAVLAGCPGAPRTTAPPLQDADLYPNARTIAGLTVAVDEITDPERTRRYFGSDLIRQGILPVRIVFTNRGDDAFSAGPRDVLLFKDNSIIDAVPPERAVIGDDARALAMKETIIRPGEAYQGVLFFRVQKKDASLYGRVERIFTDSLMLRVMVTDQETSERIPFGPYSLSGP